MIHPTTAQRLLLSPEATAFIRDLSRATGIPMRYATPTGDELSVDGTCPEPAVCQWMRADSERKQLCQRTIDGERRPQGSKACGTLCAAGLREAAVCLKLEGQPFGFLLIGQVATAAPDLVSLNRWRYALERIDQRASVDSVRMKMQDLKVVSEQRFAAVQRLAEQAVQSLEARLMGQFVIGEQALSLGMRKARAYIRQHYDQALKLKDVAAVAGISREHFCTVFRRSMGMGFNEYLNRVRIERACEMLKDRRIPITEIALASGFQSLSSFNRRFRAQIGVTPSRYRRQQEKV